jgi:hypothetical protein
MTPEECTCKLELAKKYTKNFEEYGKMILLNNDMNSPFWTENRECTKMYALKKENNQEQTNNNNGNQTTGWSVADRNQALEDCIGNPGSAKSKSTTLCECLIGKAEAVFSSYSEMKKSANNNTDFQNGLKDCEQNSGNRDN